MHYYDLVVKTVTDVPEAERYDAALSFPMMPVRVAALKVAEDLEWGTKRAARFADHCEHYAMRVTVTLSAAQIVMYSVESLKILMGEFNGDVSYILTSATLAVPHDHQSYANILAITRNIESRL